MEALLRFTDTQTKIISRARQVVAERYDLIRRVGNGREGSSLLVPGENSLGETCSRPDFSPGPMPWQPPEEPLTAPNLPFSVVVDFGSSSPLF
jgi:hypothetical protein